MGVGVSACVFRVLTGFLGVGLGGLWADQAVWVLGEYPFLRVLLLAVSLITDCP